MTSEITLFLNIATLLAVSTGLLMIPFKAGKFTQDILDKVELLKQMISQQRGEFDKYQIKTDRELIILRTELNNLKERTAGCTGCHSGPILD
jgi:hypothetical protein